MSIASYALPAAAYGAGIAYNVWRNSKKRKKGPSYPTPNKKRKIAKRAIRGKNNRSRTRMMRKKKGKTRFQVGAQRVLDSLYVSKRYKPSKRAKYTEWSKQPLTYEQISTWYCASGVSTATQSTQIITTTSSATGGFLTASNVAIGGAEMLTELFNRHSKIQNSTGPATITVDPTFSTQRYNTLFLKRMKIEINLTNQAPTTTEVDIYVVTRKNSDRTYVAQQAQQDWSAGLTVMNAAGGTNAATAFDTKPTMSKRFNSNWKIVAKYSLKMDAGQERKCTYDAHIGRYIETDYMQQQLGGIKGIYHEIFAVARGPVADSSNAFTAGNIATTKVKLVGTTKVTYTSYACQVYSKLHYQATTLTTSNASLYAIADAAGTVVNTETTTNYA